MKNSPNKVLFQILGLLSCSFSFAAPNPPEPIPPPVGLPIDDSVWVLLIACIFIAFYKLKFTKKASN